MPSKVFSFNYFRNENPVLIAELFDAEVDDAGNVAYSPVHPETVSGIVLTHKRAMRIFSNLQDQFEALHGLENISLPLDCLFSELIESPDLFAHTGTPSFPYNFICVPEQTGFYPGEGVYQTELLFVRNNGQSDELVLIPSQCVTTISNAVINVGNRGVTIVGYAYEKLVQANGQVTIRPLARESVESVEIELFDNFSNLVSTRMVSNNSVLQNVNASPDIFQGQSQRPFDYNFIYMYPDSSEMFRLGQRYFVQVNILYDGGKLCTFTHRFHVQ